MNAVAGRRPETYGLEPFRFDQMRPGCYDVDARVRDMDINGVWASVNFPSMITGFCGRVFFDAGDRELGLACVRAWNDWLFEEWYSPHPDRIVPLGITYLADPVLAAAEIRRNAARGFTSVTFPERPHEIGLPSLWDRAHWDPIMEAVVETDTVVSLHVGSSGLTPAPPGPAWTRCSSARRCSASCRSSRAPSGCGRATPSASPTLKIAMSEGGIGWVAMLRDRLENIVDRSRYGLGWDVRPADVLQRNFWFCTIDDPVHHRHAARHRGRPHHGGGRLPARGQHLARHPGRDRSGTGATFRADELRAMCCENAAALYRHPLAGRRSCRAERRTRCSHRRREAHPRADAARGARRPGPRPVAGGLQRPPGRPHHGQPRRRHPSLQPVAADLGRAAPLPGAAHRPRRRGGRR